MSNSPQLIDQQTPAPVSRALSLVFSIVLTVLVLLAAEAGLRLYDWGTGGGTHARNWWYWGFVQDRLLSYRPRPGLRIRLPGGKDLIDTNAQGFRDDDLPVQPVGPRRLVVCIGESSTWGTGSSNRMTTWPHQLEYFLKQSDPTFVVFNAGMPGYTVVENLQLLNLRLLKYRPEAVVYMGLRNDVEFYWSSLDERTDLNFYPRQLAPLPASLLNNLFMRSSLVSLAVNDLGGIVQWYKLRNNQLPKPGPRLTERGEETFRDQIALMKTLCARHGITLLWVDQPVNYAKSDAVDGIKAARQVLRDELSRDRVPLLQAATIYDYKRFQLVDDVHFTDEDNRYLASILAPQILEELNRRRPPVHQLGNATIKNQ